MSDRYDQFFCSVAEVAENQIKTLCDVMKIVLKTILKNRSRSPVFKVTRIVVISMGVFTIKISVL